MTQNVIMMYTRPLPSFPHIRAYYTRLLIFTIKTFYTIRFSRQNMNGGNSDDGALQQLFYYVFYFLTDENRLDIIKRYQTVGTLFALSL
jgi:hypothetical protein